MEHCIKNPILAGSYPSPSIVRVEDDFYLVCASYSYFPGIPIFHSRDLAHWEQIGHVLDRKEQLPLNAEMMSHGIWAPTIRYHDGLFYVSTKNVDHGFNFIVTAADPAGPWSNPYWIRGTYGIDPSLFFDEDGKVYYLTTGSSPEYRNQNIYLSEFDIRHFQLIGLRTAIWNGAMKDVWTPEAPHLYKKDDWYYLITAEGGTEHFHAVSVARSRNICGPYEGYAGNPVLTHRHLGISYPITNVGHGDLVELKDGSWYMAVLASRPYGGYHKNMGREAFLVPVSWENGWPLVSPGTGKVEWSYPAPKLPCFHVESEAERDEFEKDRLDFYWIFLGTPEENTCRIEESRLKLRLSKFSFKKEKFDAFFEKIEPAVQSASFLGRRQKHMDFDIAAKLEFSPKEQQTAGIMLLQNDFHLLALECALTEEGSVIRVVKGYASLEGSLTFKENTDTYQREILGQLMWESPVSVLKVKVRGQDAAFYVRDEAGKQTVAAEHVDCSFLGFETSGGMLGTCVGMFASGNGRDYDEYAAFDWFEYRGLESDKLISM